MKFDKLVNNILNETNGVDSADVAAIQRSQRLDKERQRSEREPSGDSSWREREINAGLNEPDRPQRNFKQRQPGSIFKDKNGNYWEVTDVKKPNGDYKIKPADSARVKMLIAHEEEGRRQANARWKAGGKTDFASPKANPAWD